MNTLRRPTSPAENPDFEFELDMGDFDINAAFQEAVSGIANDAEMALEEKISRMENIISEGTAEIYRDFVDFRQIASRIEMMCSHDHMLNHSMQNSDVLSGFRDSHKDDGHDHHSIQDSKHEDKHGDDEYEIDPVTGKKTKKKKKHGWFSLVMAKSKK